MVRACRAIAVGLHAVLLAAGVCASAREIAFIAHPRTGGFFRTQSVAEWEGEGPYHGGPYVCYPDADLVVRDLESGDERVLIDGGVVDFSITLDGKSVLATRTSDGGRSEIIRVNIESGATKRLIVAEAWICQPVEHATGIAFLSNRDGWKNPHEGYRALTIYAADRDGRHPHRLWHAGLGGVFGLALGKDGRLYFSSGENQGTGTQGSRGTRGVFWSIWSINPDGSDFQPEISAIGSMILTWAPWDWPVITSDGSLVAAKYYDIRIYGTLHVCPPPSGPRYAPGAKFGSPLVGENHPPVLHGPTLVSAKAEVHYGFQRRGMYALTPWTTDIDSEALDENGKPCGIVSHPWPIPGNGVYFTWTGDEGDDKCDLGVYMDDDVTTPIASHRDLVKVVNEPTRHEWMGKQIASFREIYGVDPPAPTKVIAKELPAGSPYAVLGSSGVNYHEWALNGIPWPNDAKLLKMEPDEAEWLRVLAFNPTLAKQVAGVDKIQNGPQGDPFDNFEGFSSAFNERVGWYETLIPLKKWTTPDGRVHVGPNPPAASKRLVRSDGLPDTSFRVELPANQPVSLQLLNAKKEAIRGSTAQTWHQFAPQESNTGCQGCHAHHEPDPVMFADTHAARDDYQALRLRQIKTVVFGHDIESLGAGLGPRPWWNEPANLKPIQALGSAATDVDDNSAFSPEQAELVRAWIDTGMMAEGMVNGRRISPESQLGPYADTIGPTVNIAVLRDRIAVGMLDPQAGLDLASLSITLDGVDVTAEFELDPAEDVWTRRGEPPTGELAVVVRDTHGNVTARSMTIDPAALREEGQQDAAPAGEGEDHVARR